MLPDFQDPLFIEYFKQENIFIKSLMFLNLLKESRYDVPENNILVKPLFSQSCISKEKYSSVII